MLATEYALYHGERPKAQFLEVHDVVSRTIAGTHVEKEDQRRLLGTIKANADAMKRLFLRLVAQVDKVGGGGGKIPEGIAAHLTGQLVVRSRRVAADATRLEILVNEHMARSRRQTTGAIAAVIVLTAVPLTVMLIRTQKNITLSLETLRKGTEAVSRGNLDHSVEVDVDDEVGDVSRAFNRMTGELKKSDSFQGRTAGRGRRAPSSRDRAAGCTDLSRNREREHGAPGPPRSICRCLAAPHRLRGHRYPPS